MVTPHPLTRTGLGLGLALIAVVTRHSSSDLPPRPDHKTQNEPITCGGQLLLSMRGSIPASSCALREYSAPPRVAAVAPAELTVPLA